MSLFPYPSLFLVLQAASSLSGFSINLSNHSWNLSQDSGALRVQNLNIPTGVITDLRKGGVLPSSENVYYRFNDQRLRWISESNWTYSLDIKTFPREKYKYVILNLKGIDTVSEVKWNNASLGKTDNMFKEYYLMVKNYEYGVQNMLSLSFTSPIQYGKAVSESYLAQYGNPILPDCPPSEYGGECHVNFLRKMQASFGWDWGPAFPSMGIWKPVHLIFTNHLIQIDGLKWEVQLWEGKWRATLGVIILSQSVNIIGSLDISIPELHYDDRQQIRGRTRPSVHTDLRELQVNFSMDFDRETVETWWPNGHGTQKLYSLKASFNSEASKEIKVAFRTLNLLQKPLKPRGLTFMFQINGKIIFAKGSNWIPSHVLPEQMDPHKMRHILESARKTGMNMLRVWGGGVYEADAFYSMADQMGLLIWQDFMFACSLYPSNEEFLQSVREEVIQQVRRLQHHASLALWAGNNENEAVLSGNWYGSDSNFKEYSKDYEKLYEQTIREALSEEDSTRPYMVSSPSNGDGPSSLKDTGSSPYDPLYGDTHYYNYYSQFWDPIFYPSTRFASEFGFQSISSLEDLLSVSDPDIDLTTLDSKFFQSRMHHPGGFIQLRSQIESYFGLKEAQVTSRRGVERFIYLSQIYQAVGLKVEIEHYRRNSFQLDAATGKGLTMGALYWQLNDIWPGISWSTINYGGSWKIGHYYVQRAFRSVLLSPVLNEKSLQLHILDENEVIRPFEAHIEVHIQRWGSFQAKKLSIPVKYHGHEIKTFVLDRILKIGECGHGNISRLSYCYIRFDLVQDGTVLSSNDIYDLPKALIGLSSDPKTTIENASRVGTDNNVIEITLSTKEPAIYVHLTAKGYDGEFSDGGFFLMTKNHKILFESRKEISDIDEFRRSLKLEYYIK